MYNYKALKKWRKKCKLTQEEVADELKLAKRTSITTYENGKVNFGVKNLGIIIDLFSNHLSINQLNEFMAELFEIRLDMVSQPAIINAHVEELEKTNEKLREDEKRARYYMKIAEDRARKAERKLKDTINNFFSCDRKDDLPDGDEKKKRKLPFALT